VDDDGWEQVSGSEGVAAAVSASALERAGSVLVTGSSREVLRGVPTGLVEVAASDGDGFVGVTTGSAPRTLLERVEREVAGVARERVGIVDARPNVGSVRSNPRPLRWRVRSPMDLTGTSMAVHECLETLFERGVSTRHVLFDSLSRLVLGGDVQTVARFVHQLVVMTHAPGALGVYPVATSATPDGALDGLTHLFDGVVEVRRTDGTRELRCRGLPDTATDWVDIGPGGPDLIGGVSVR